MNNTLKRIFEVYVIALAFLFASRPINDPDFWFHLKTGEYIIKTGLMPRAETFSCTNLGQPWNAHQWLSGVLFYTAFTHLGPKLLIFMFAVFGALGFWLIFRRSSEHIYLRGLVILLGVWTAVPNMGVKPRVFSLLFVSIYFIVLNNYLGGSKSKSLWWLVPLMILWVNLHGAFLVGLVLIGLTVVGGLFDSLVAREEFGSSVARLKTLTLILLACFVATFLNPYGPGIYYYILGVLSSPVYQNTVIDWLSPNFHQPELFPLTILILSAIGTLVLSPKRPRPSELLFFAATLYMTLKMQRNAMIFAVIASSLLADYSGHLWESIFKRASPNASVLTVGFQPAPLNLLLLLPLVLFVMKVKNVVYGPVSQQTSAVPIKAVEYLNAHAKVGCTFTDPNVWGAYLLWAAPSNPAYIDGRDVYPMPFVREYLEIIQGQRDWHGPFERYGVSNVILAKTSVLTMQMKNSPDWERAYEDDYSVVFTKRSLEH